MKRIFILLIVIGLCLAISIPFAILLLIDNTNLSEVTTKDKIVKNPNNDNKGEPEITNIQFNKWTIFFNYEIELPNNWIIKDNGGELIIRGDGLIHAIVMYHENANTFYEKLRNYLDIYPGEHTEDTFTIDDRKYVKRNYHGYCLEENECTSGQSSIEIFYKDYNEVITLLFPNGKTSQMDSRVMEHILLSLVHLDISEPR